MKYRHALRAYEMGCEQVADAFVNQYFSGVSWEWIGDEVGGTLQVCDYFFGLDDMVIAVKLLPPWELIDEWWDEAMECEFGESPSLESFLKKRNIA